jgi:hypothetical protein
MELSSFLPFFKVDKDTWNAAALSNSSFILSLTLN